MFGKNVIPFVPVAPAEKVIAGATSDASCAAYKLTQTGASFTSTVKVGDLVIRTSGTGAPVSAYVTKVLDDENLLLDEDLGFDSNTFDVLHPGERRIRTPAQVEWVIRSVEVKDGDAVHRVGLWFSDSERSTMLLDTKRLYEREGLSDGKGFWVRNQDILVSHESLLLLRNYTEETIEPVIYGVNKTLNVSD